MLNITRLGTCSSSEKISYYTEHANVDYYQSSCEPHGVWLGKLSEQLRLINTPVMHDDLLMIAQGYSVKGKELIKNAGEKHQIGFDLTFSAPKSVSVLFGLSEQNQRQQIQKCHFTAVKKVLDYAEKNLIESRIGFDEYKNRKRVKTQKALWAAFEHGSSRLNDPQLHTHCMLLNLTYLSQVGYRCIETPNLYKHQKALGVMYRNELSFQLKQQLNLAIEPDESFFKLPEVSDQLCDLFSKRTQEIDEKVAENSLNNSSATRQKAAIFTRSKKQHIPREKLYQNWLIEAESQVEKWEPEYKNSESIQVDSLTPYKDEILLGLVEFQSIFQHKDILEIVNKYAQWYGLGVDYALKFVDDLMKDKELKPLLHPVIGECYTTQSQHKLEKYFYNSAVEYSKFFEHSISNTDLIEKHCEGLNPEQKEALFGVATGSDITCVNGMPGTGKSFLAKNLKCLMESEGYKVLGCSTAGIAAQELEQGSGIKSQTLDSLLNSIKNKKTKLTSKTLLVIDEAGMIGINKLNELFNHAIKARTKIVLVGDFQQLPAIQAGNAFQKLIDKLGAFKLEHIQRQNEQIDRDNVKNIGQGKLNEVLLNLDDRGLLHFGEDHTLVKAKLVNNWFEDFKLNAKETLILASTTSNVNDLNLLARQKMKQEYKLSGIPVLFSNYAKYTFSLQKGERIMFRKNSYEIGVKNGMTATIVNIKKLLDKSLAITVKLDSGLTVDFNSQFYDHFDYGYASTVHKSQGVTKDFSHVFIDEKYINREMMYVQTSRSRNPTQVYCANSLLEKSLYLEMLSDKASQQTTKLEIMDTLEL